VAPVNRPAPWWRRFAATYAPSANLISAAHPVALFVYAGLAVKGVLYLLDIAQSQSVDRLIGDIASGVWHLGMLAAGALAVYGAVQVVIAITADDTRRGLWWENLGCGLIVLTHTTYFVALAIGGVTAWHTISDTTTLVLAAAARLGLNLWRELAKVPPTEDVVEAQPPTDR
jgi:hypothetical protein